MQFSLTLHAAFIYEDLPAVNKWNATMKCSGIAVATVVVILLTSTAAFAQDFPFWNFWHHHGHGHGHHPGPAPLLAAGIPAFAALGGGAMVSSLTRRFRRQK
jgi:hypothetical protein